MLDRIRTHLANTVEQRAALARDLEPLRDKYHRAVLAAEARFAEAMLDADRFTYRCGDGTTIYGYRWAALHARADRALSDELAAADRDFRRAAAPIEARHLGAITTVAVAKET